MYSYMGTKAKVVECIRTILTLIQADHSQLQYFNDCQQNLLINNNEKIKKEEDKSSKKRRKKKEKKEKSMDVSMSIHSRTSKKFNF